MRFKVGDKVKLKGIKGGKKEENNSYVQEFLSGKGRKKGDIVTITTMWEKTPSTNGKHYFFDGKTGFFEEKDFESIEESDWKARLSR